MAIHTAIVAYRLFRFKDLDPEVLFHSFPLDNKKTKRVPLDTWICAEEKQTWNPGKKNGPGFISGWHVVVSEKECIKYLKKFKNSKDIKICKVLVKGLRHKPRSQVMLAKWMLVPKDAWLKAIN